MLVSVLIPCFNCESYLAPCLESVLGQTYPRIEVVVVDDGSTDGSLALARRFEKHGVKVISQQNRGQPAALNAGFAVALGDYIQYLDADDVLDRDKIKVQIERLASADRLAMASGAWCRFRNDLSEAMFAAEAVWQDLSGVDWLITSWLGGGMMPVFAFLTPRELVERAGPFNERLVRNNDLDFFSRVMLLSSGVLFCNDARGYYRSGQPTMSRRRDRAALVSAFEAIDISSRRLLERCNSSRASEACATQFQRFVYDTYPQALDLVAQAERRVSELGGSGLRPGGGRVFQLLAKCFGWKFAKRCQQAWHSLKAPRTGASP